MKSMMHALTLDHMYRLSIDEAENDEARKAADEKAASKAKSLGKQPDNGSTQPAPRLLPPGLSVSLKSPPGVLFPRAAAAQTHGLEESRSHSNSGPTQSQFTTAAEQQTQSAVGNRRPWCCADTRVWGQEARYAPGR